MPQRVAHAKAYPFTVPGHSYVYEGGAVLPMVVEETDFSGRTPVIACGSNRSPDQLHSKFGRLDGAATIPVQRAWLEGFDVVYAAHITRYGSIAATLQHVPGASVEVAITWLTEEQLELMHGTEGRGASYDYARLDGLDLSLDGGGALASAFAYVYRNGCLAEDGGPVALGEVPATGRPHRAMRQPEVQALVHARLADGGELDTFILENLTDAELRRAREERLWDGALAFAWPRVTTI